MLPQAPTYDELLRRFAWRIPDRFNIGGRVLRPLGGVRSRTASRSSTSTATGVSRN